jgi:hypothetical protein
MSTTKTLPVHADDAIEYFRSCAEAFACLSVLLGAIQDNADDAAGRAAKGALLISGLHVADRFASLADGWRRELEAGGVQP